MRKIVAITLCFVSAVLFRRIAFADAPVGVDIYQQHCIRCHNYPAPGSRSDRQWAIIIAHMRDIGNLTGEQSRAVLEFLQSSNNPSVSDQGARVGMSSIAAEQRWRSDMRTNATLSGKDLFAQKSCSGCHVFHGQGGGVGPSLDGLFTRRSMDYIVEHIKNPRSHNTATVMPPLGLTDAEISKLVEYLKTGQ